MRRLTLVLSLALLVYACSSGDGTAPGPSGSIQLAAPRTDMAPGESVQLTWQVKDAAGNVQSSQTATFTSSSAAIATVTAAGVVTAVKGGTATITATAGSASGQVTFIVFEGGLVTSTGATIARTTAQWNSWFRRERWRLQS